MMHVNKRTILVLICLLILGGLMSIILMQHSTTRMVDFNGFEVVSIMQLIVDPQNWSGRSVRVMGYLSDDTSPKLFASEWSAEVFDYASAFDIDNPAGEVSFSEACGDRYVEIRGSFEKFEGNYVIADVLDILDPINLRYCYLREDE